MMNPFDNNPTPYRIEPIRPPDTFLHDGIGRVVGVADFTGNIFAGPLAGSRIETGMVVSPLHQTIGVVGPGNVVSPPPRPLMPDPITGILR